MRLPQKDLYKSQQLTARFRVGSRTPSVPDASQRTLLAEPRFVFVKDLQPAVGIVRLDLRETLAKFFLNSSCAAGSVWGCCGLGTSDE